MHKLFSLRALFPSFCCNRKTTWNFVRWCRERANQRARERTPTPSPEHVLSSVVQLAKGTKNPSTGKSSEPCASSEHITTPFSFVDDGSCSIYLLLLHTSCYLPEAQQRTAWSGLVKYRWSGTLEIFRFVLCRCLAVWVDESVCKQRKKIFAKYSRK